MRHHFLTLFLLLIAGLTPVKADNITVGGQSRSYLVYAPKDLGENRPLFIFCHGSGQDANYMLNTQFRDTQNPERKISIEAVCDTAKFVILFPNGINNQWDIGGDRDINLVKALIDKMATQYKIDRNRVYLGGFSMGGMFTYHAMNKIPDLIAAFVPVSGYPMGGATANANVRPLPILHIHGTGDDVCVFSGVQPALNVWIRHNGCPTTAKTVNNYNGFNAKMHTWAPGNDGVEVKLLELAGKGHWVCKEPQVYTGKEMWNFCRNYSLNRTKPSVSITSPKAGLIYNSMAPQGTATFPDIAITATADDPNGTVSKVEFYDGTTLLATCTAKPYKATLTGAKAGTHTIKVVATDNDGESASATTTVTLSAAQTLNLSQKFNENASIPTGWTTYDSDERRVGYSNGYSSGCRVMQLTGSPRAFNYGFYFRNKNGNNHAGWIKYGLAEAGATLSLAPGHYVLKYMACNWNRETPTPLEFAVENHAGTTAVASTTFTPTVNIGNTASNAFSGVTEQQFEFDIESQGDYVIAVYADASGWSDGMVGKLTLTAMSYVSTGIASAPVNSDASLNSSLGGFAAKSPVYTLRGQQVDDPVPGTVYIIDGKKVLVK